MDRITTGKFVILDFGSIVLNAAIEIREKTKHPVRRLDIVIVFFIEVVMELTLSRYSIRVWHLIADGVHPMHRPYVPDEARANGQQLRT